MSYEELAEEFLNVKGILSADEIHSAVMSGDKGVDFVLAYVLMNECVVSKQISAAMGVSTARTAVLLNTMEKDKLILRRRDYNDGRRTVIEILPAGRERYDLKRKKLKSAVVKLLESLGPDDASEYIRLHRKIAENIKKIH